MKTEMLNALLSIRLRIYETGVCCQKFNPSQLMLSKFNSKQMYPRTLSNPNKSLSVIPESDFTADEMELLDILQDAAFVCVDDSFQKKIFHSSCILK